ncbi:MAG: hypothetical protein LBU65_02340 [Planctomycetaceae bacterium]|jgi:hypothetical protein|nr:hypothetical protein [Planctomycetaceae bacterium]
MRSPSIIKKEAMELLVNALGVIETEVFITELQRVRFDYTEWQRDYFDKKYTLDTFMQKAVQYSREHPFEQQ